jgi:hypothetical protein
MVYFVIYFIAMFVGPVMFGGPGYGPGPGPYGPYGPYRRQMTVNPDMIVSYNYKLIKHFQILINFRPTMDNSQDQS